MVDLNRFPLEVYLENSIFLALTRNSCTQHFVLSFPLAQGNVKTSLDLLGLGFCNLSTDLGQGHS